MEYPNIWKAGNLVDHCLTGGVKECTDDGYWQPCRPLGMPTLQNRVRAAWLVFTGRADAVLWDFRHTKRSIHADDWIGREVEHAKAELAAMPEWQRNAVRAEVARAAEGEG